jgi:hypothetical protein
MPSLIAPVAVFEQTGCTYTARVAALSPKFFTGKIWIVTKLASAPEIERMERQQIGVIGYSQARIVVGMK